MRLTHSRDFDRVFKRADIRSRYGALRIAAVANRMASPRMGLVVSKRAVRKAVERNRIKRVLREEFRGRRRFLPALDIVIQVVARADNSALRADADILFTRLAVSPGDET